MLLIKGFALGAAVFLALLHLTPAREAYDGTVVWFPFGAGVLVAFAVIIQERAMVNSQSRFAAIGMALELDRCGAGNWKQAARAEIQFRCVPRASRR